MQRTRLQQQQQQKKNVCTLMCLNIGTLKNHEFSIWDNRKLMVLGVPVNP